MTASVSPGLRSPEFAREFSEAEELYALGLPMEMIVSQTGIKRSRLEWWFRSYAQVRHADRVAAKRIARTERIKSNIAEYPGKPMCFPAGSEAA